VEVTSVMIGAMTTVKARAAVPGHSPLGLQDTYTRKSYICSLHSCSHAVMKLQLCTQSTCDKMPGAMLAHMLANL